MSKKIEVEWHSVKEEGMPKESGVYLVTCVYGTRGKVIEDYFCSNCKEWDRAVGAFVASWAELPSPYMPE